MTQRIKARGLRGKSKQKDLSCRTERANSFLVVGMHVNQDTGQRVPSWVSELL